MIIQIDNIYLAIIQQQFKITFRLYRASVELKFKVNCKLILNSIHPIILLLGKLENQRC